MANLQSVLRKEIARIARKEIRAATQVMRGANTQHRAHIAALRRQMQEQHKMIAALRKQLARATKASARAAPAAVTKPAGGGASSARLGELRQKLELSAADFGRLVGVQGQTVYKWERGARPRARQLEKIAEVRRMSKAAARALAASLRDS